MVVPVFVAGDAAKRLALAVAAAAVLVLAAPLSPVRAADGVVTPVADSYVDAAAPGSNFGASSTLRTDGSPIQRTFIKFNVTGAGSSAALRVYSTTDHPGFRVHRVTGPNATTWGETTITYTNAPPVGEMVASSGPVTPGTWVTLDISPLVTGNGLVSLAITTASSKSISMDSRETTRDPELVVPAPTSPSPYVISREGTGSVYHAQSSTGTSYSGSLKSVVESAVGTLNRAGGGEIRFQSGDFDLGNSQFELHDMVGIKFLGQGMDATTIRNSMSSTSFDTEPFDVSTAYGVTIRDMTVFAGGPFRSTSDAIDFDGGNNTVIERVKVTGARGRGIVFDGKDVVGGVPRTADNNTIKDCVITGVPSDGIELLAASSNHVEGCVITNTGGHGIQVTKASSSAGQPHKPSTDNVVVGNTVDNAGQDGVNVTSGHRNQITANMITNSSDDTSSRDGIRVSAADSKPCDDNVISNDTATDNQAVKTQRYGLAITSSLCHRTVVVDNNFAGNKTGAILDQGTDTQYSATPDTESPSIPTDLTATAVASNRVDLAWSASTDNVAVSGYTIFRDGTAIATVGASTLSYSDTSVAPITSYTYTVDAFDAEANHSGQSSPASATTPPGPATVTFTPTADSYVSETSPTTNYGPSTQLRVDGSPVLNAYLRFNVQNVTGTIVGATLRVYANSSSSTGHDVRPVADNTWNEATVNFNNAPTFGAAAGSSGAFTSGQYIEVDVTALVTGNGTINLAMTGPGGTAISYASRESTTPPQLVVEVAA